MTHSQAARLHFLSRVLDQIETEIEEVRRETQRVKAIGKKRKRWTARP